MGIIDISRGATPHRFIRLVDGGAPTWLVQTLSSKNEQIGCPTREHPLVHRTRGRFTNGDRFDL